MDQPITQWINSFAGSNVLLDSIMIMATKVGVPLLVALVVAQWWSKIDRMHVRHTCIAAGLSFLIGLGLNQIILLFVHRVRPYDAGVSHLIISKSADWSFPSDHATASIAIVAAFALHGLPRRTLLFGFLALLICWPRIFVGTHHLTDVRGGGLTDLVAPRWYGYSIGRNRDSIALHGDRAIGRDTQAAPCVLLFPAYSDCGRVGKLFSILLPPISPQLNIGSPESDRVTTARLSE